MTEKTPFHEAMSKPAAERAPAPVPMAATGEYNLQSQDVPAICDYQPDVTPGMAIVGRYKLLEKIGEGGMGEVWAAKQEEPVKRMVALKLIKAGMDSKAVLGRFEAERQALALMDHPNIARVLDGGRTDKGQPFFVMELVKGIPITKYCDANRLAIHPRLELFVQVCQALQHAHQKGIIHRDIKPSNVLVARCDDRPVVKVIDFGLAKAMGQHLTERTMCTEFGAVVGTLEYMSPEQAELTNQDIDTRSDIYSLGVLLYEMLAGTTPLEQPGLKRDSFMETLRVIREEEAPRPSTRLNISDDTLTRLSSQRQTPPAKLLKQMRGELDWIVMKCLEKDRTRRYETANGLARDIERYLHDESVEACPPSTAYRLKKYLRRYKGLVLTVTVVLLALVGGIVGTTGAMLEARQQRRGAEQATARAIEAHFLRLTEERRQVLADGVNDAVESLVALAAAFDTWPKLSRAEFGTFVRRILDRHPEVQALEWVPRVPAMERKAVEAAAQAEGLTGFHLREIGPHGDSRTAADRPEYFPVLYVEPADRNQAARGLDLGASAPRRRALQQAVDTAQPIASGPIRLAQEQAEQMGFLLILPVYRGPSATVDERRQSLRGFTLAVFRTGDLVDRVLGDLARREVALTIHDEDAEVGDSLIYRSLNPAPASPSLTVTHSIAVGGRRWRLTFAALPDESATTIK